MSVLYDGTWGGLVGVYLLLAMAVGVFQTAFHKNGSAGTMISERCIVNVNRHLSLGRGQVSSSCAVSTEIVICAL